PKNGRACVTFAWKYPTQGEVNKEMWLQRRPDGATTANRYRRIKLERGCVATRWCPAERESALRCVQGELDGLQQAAAAAQSAADSAQSAADSAKTTANSALTAAATAKAAADAAQSTATAAKTTADAAQNTATTAKTAADAAKADGAAAMGKALEVEGKLAGMCNPNLLGGTSEEWTETAATLKVPIVGDIAEGETVTLSLDLEPGADVKSFLIYNSGWKGSQDCGHMIPVDGKAQMTWQWKYPTQGDVNKELWLQPRPDGTTGVNRMRCIKLERGPVATPWCRAESDLALRAELEELRQKVAVLEKAAEVSAVGRVMSVAGLMSHPEQNVLDSKLVVNGVVDVWLSEDDYFVFGVSTVNPSNGMGATMMVTYFEGAEAFGTRQGNAVYPTVGCVLINRSNGKMYCMENGSLKTISG
ncbi:MAG: hypothetical protein K2I56_07205, partial [Muribaculaceae bacterium]|nr:hypothetical protein [Muribaculaceae bacterium]